MNEYLEIIKQKRINKTINNLKANFMEAYCVTSKQELIDLLEKMVFDKTTVSYGGSVTLEEAGVLDYLRKKNITLLDRDSGEKTPEEKEEIMRSTFSSDTFLTSSNAITEAGELYNVDGRGNRVAAMIYGPKSVIVIAGYNKIVGNIDDAVQRVKKTAAPANTIRLGCKTPCVKTGECKDCKSPERICCSYVIMAQQRVQGRIKVIITTEGYGL